MRRQLVVSAAILLGMGFARVLEAQEDRRSVEAALANLQAPGGPTAPEFFQFQGCPQQDATGRAVFNAVRDAEVRPHGRAALAMSLAWNAYPACAYEPLDNWLVEVFEDLVAAGEDGAANSLASGLWRKAQDDGFTLDDNLREAFLRAAENETLLEGPRRQFVTAAFVNRPEGVLVGEVVDLLFRDVPRSSRSFMIARMSRERGAVFYPALARVAQRMTDDQLFLLTTSLAEEIRMGRAEPQAAGLEALRAEVARRPELPSWAQIPRERGRGR